MFRNTRHIHFVAIGGVGMSGIAEVLLNLGFSVSGSDIRRSATTDRLASHGARIHIGHAADQVLGADVVVRSTAVTEANVEVSEARRRRIPVIRRAEMLAELMRLKEGVAIAGSHGKTTTTSMTAATLAAGGLDPTVIVGGKVLSLGTGAVLGGGDYLVAEADESDGSFLHLVPTIAVVTNIDHEHVDHYPDLASLRLAFARFLQRVPFYGTAILCQDDPLLRELAASLDRRVVTYGVAREAQVRADEATITQGAQGLAADVWAGDRRLGRLRLPQAGWHNLRNGLAALAVARELGVEFDVAAAALGSFAGIGRRCEHHGEHGGVMVLDDYGHHPTELVATMEVARAYRRRLVVLFEPHRFSRTRYFQGAFADALAGADEVGLLPVYAASEPDPGDVDSGLLAAALEARAGRTATVLPDVAAITGWLDQTVRPGDLLLTMGAGEIGRMVGDLCRYLDTRGAP